VAKGRRIRPTVGLALLFLLVASLFSSEFPARGAFGLPDDHTRSSPPATIKGNDQGEASGPVGGAPRGSVPAFTHDFDSEGSPGAGGSGIGHSTIIGDEPGLPKTGTGAGSGPGADGANFGLGNGSATGGAIGNPHSYDQGWSGSGAGDTPSFGASSPLPGGGAGGPFPGRGGRGDSDGPGGSSRSGDSSGDSSGPGGRGGPDSGSHTPDLLFSGTDPGGSDSGAPGITAPNSASRATVPGAPTIILVLVGVAMLRGSTKLRRTERP
jgi:hypothetical protein